MQLIISARSGNGAFHIAGGGTEAGFFGAAFAFAAENRALGIGMRVARVGRRPAHQVKGLGHQPRDRGRHVVPAQLQGTQRAGVVEQRA